LPDVASGRSLQNYALRVMSGQARGAGAAAVRAVAAVASPIYSAVMRARNAMFDRGIGVKRLPRPVIAVGNLTTGGTGKTPVVRWLYEHLRQLGHAPAVLMRGYRARAGQAGDEQAMLRALLGEGAIVHADSSRYRGGMAVLRERPEVTAFILDDGFQHRSLARDFDLLLIDATNPFGYGHVLPRGLLREPPAGLRRASAILITRVDLADAGTVGRIVVQVRKYNERAPVYRSAVSHTGLVKTNGDTVPMQWLAGKKFFAFAGIGNPPALEQQLRAGAGEMVGTRWLPDHHHYSPGDVEVILREARRLSAEVVLTTQKDWVKVAPLTGTADAVMRIEPGLTFEAQDESALLEQVQSCIKSVRR
jgi:tetraacyldisaccharide 4'-kinase